MQLHALHAVLPHYMHYYMALYTQIHAVLIHYMHNALSIHYIHYNDYMCHFDRRAQSAFLLLLDLF